MDSSAHIFADAQARARPSGRSEPGVSVEVRHLSTDSDYAQAVELQNETWGQGFHGVVPPAILKVTQRVGGISAGAFDATGGMLGFLYGMSGVEDGRFIHWSHMLAVRLDSRDLGI